MKRVSVLAAGVCAAVLVGAAPAKKAATSAPPPPIANYWMDVSTTSGFGAGMMGGGRPSLGQIMGMMNGGGANAVAHSLLLRLSSRERPAGAPQAQHFIPAGLQMGPALPLVTPQPVKVDETPSEPSGPTSYEKPKGRMMIYWGCGEHAAAPMVIDFAKMAEGQIPANLQALAKMGRAMGRMAAHAPSAENSAGFGEWPNTRDSRPVPATGSLVGAHRVEGNYSPPMAFTLGAGQDFMPGLGLTDAGPLPSGADRLVWQLAPQATGYALAMFGGSRSGDMIIWTSARNASLAPAFDYVSPSEARRLVADGALLAPSVNQCVLPAEVANAVPAGMVMGIGYGPEAYFTDNPKAPKWAARVRFKTTAMLMRGMRGMGGYDGEAAVQQQQQPPQKKRRGFGLDDLIGGVVPH